MDELKAVSILVTRPQHQAEALCRMIERHGGQAIRLPTIAVVPPEQTAPVIAKLKTLHNFQWLVFISANAVNFALSAINGKIGQLRGVHIAAIGTATARALLEAGVAVDLVPESGFDSESLLALPLWQDVAGQRFLIARGNEGRSELAGVLRARGAEVEYLDVYRRILPDADCTEVIALLNCGGLNAVTVTSGENLSNLLILLGDSCRSQLTATPLVVGSGRIADIARKQGFRQIHIADSPTDASILKAILQCTAGEKRGRIE